MIATVFMFCMSLLRHVYHTAMKLCFHAVPQRSCSPLNVRPYNAPNRSQTSRTIFSTTISLMTFVILVARRAPRKRSRASVRYTRSGKRAIHTNHFCDVICIQEYWFNQSYAHFPIRLPALPHNSYNQTTRNQEGWTGCSSG